MNLILWWLGISLACFLLILYFLSNSRRSKMQEEIQVTELISPRTPDEPCIQSELEQESLEDLEPLNFPGEDSNASQLDLARAYIDMGRFNLARKILEPLASKEQMNLQLQNLAKILLSECTLREAKGL